MQKERKNYQNYNPKNKQIVLKKKNIDLLYLTVGSSTDNS